jgi:hypothetical protein
VDELVKEIEKLLKAPDKGLLSIDEIFEIVRNIRGLASITLGIVERALQIIIANHPDEIKVTTKIVVVYGWEK